MAARRGIVEIRGRGLLWAARLDVAIANDVRERGFEAGLLINSPRPDTLRLMPSLRISDAEIDEALEMLDAALAQARQG